MQAKYGQGKSEALEAALIEALADCAFLAPARVRRHIRLAVNCLPSDLHVFGVRRSPRLCFPRTRLCHATITARSAQGAGFDRLDMISSTVLVVVRGAHMALGVHVHVVQRCTTKTMEAAKQMQYYPARLLSRGLQHGGHAFLGRIRD